MLMSLLSTHSRIKTVLGEHHLTMANAIAIDPPGLDLLDQPDIQSVSFRNASTGHEFQVVERSVILGVLVVTIFTNGRAIDAKPL